MRTLLLAFTLVVALHAQLPANLDCKCSAIGNGEYLCKCVAASGTATSTPAAAETKTAPVPGAASAVLPTDAAKTQTTSTASTTTPKAGETPTGETTAKGQPIYTGPRGGQYHYSSSGKKVYTRKK
jgi:hypothetical protein